jgi:peptidoglycan hydrolase-like protein with peptidoglycan-binding domain
MGAYDYGRPGDGSGSMYTNWSEDLFGDAGAGLGDDPYYGPGTADGTLYTDQPTMFAVQGALQRRGFNPGTIDGKFGPNTELALAAFNAQRGQVKRGPPDLETLHALGLAPGGYAYSGAGVAPGSVAMGPSTPAHIPGTVAVQVAPGTLASQGLGPTHLQPQTPAGGKAGKAGSAGGVLGYLKANAAMIGIGVAVLGLGVEFTRGRGGGPAPRRRRRRR